MEWKVVRDTDRKLVISGDDIFVSYEKPYKYMNFYRVKEELGGKVSEYLFTISSEEFKSLVNILKLKGVI